MSSGIVSSSTPDRPLSVVRDRSPARRGGGGQNGRPVVVVLGMHRSGTSLLSNLLHFLGVDMADTTDRVSKNNAGGFWERPELNDLQDEVLAAIGRPIASPEHCLPFPAAWWRRKEVQAIKPRLIAFTERELARSSNLWGFKDPRTCRLLPLWSEIFRELDLTPIYIHAIRSPAESSLSMSLKSRVRSISATQGELMWIAYNYDILRYVALDQPTLTVDYDEWFADGHRLARRLADALGVGEELSDDDLRECVDAVVSPDLRHHVAGKGEAVSRMPIASLLYDAMLGEERATAAGARALKNQMSFIGLLMKSTAPIIDELVPLARLREDAAQTDAEHVQRIATLGEELAVLGRKLHAARDEAERLRPDADVAGRLRKLDETVRQIAAGDLAQRLEAIERGLERVVEPDDLRIKLQKIESRLRGLAENDAGSARLAEIEARLEMVAEGRAIEVRLDGIADQVGRSARHEDIADLLDAIGVRFGESEARLAARIETVAQAAALRDEVARLQDDGTRLTRRLAGNVRRVRAVVAAARRDRAALARQRDETVALADRDRESGDRLAIERTRAQRLSFALTARDAQIQRLEARLASTPVGEGRRDAALARPGRDPFGAAAADYGYSGGIDRVDRDGVAGWLRFAAWPDLVPVVELVVEGRFVLAQACTVADDCCVFAISWRDVSGEHAGRTAILRVSGFEQPIDGPALVIPGSQRHRHQAPAHRAAEVFGVALPKAEKYQAALAANDKTGDAGEAYARLAAGGAPMPTITVIVFGDTSGAAAAATIDALQAQAYANWEALCLAAPVTLEEIDPRVRVLPAGSAPRAAASGELVSFVEAGDLLAPGALVHLASAARDAPGFTLIYSDEDRIDPLTGVRGLLSCKGGWSDDLAATRDDASRLALVHRDHLPPDDAINRARVHQIVTAAARTAPDTVIHLPRVLYHRSVAGDRAGLIRRSAAVPDPTPAPPVAIGGEGSEQALIDTVAAHRFFDAAWYLAQNPDAGSPEQAARHFVRTGAAAGRDPGPEFSSAYYLRIHGDVRAAGVPAFLHFLESGEAGGRTAYPLEPDGDALRLPSRPLVAAAMLTGETRLATTPEDVTWREPGDEPDAIRLGGVALGLGAGALDSRSRAALDAFALMHGWPIDRPADGAQTAANVTVLTGPFASAALRVADLAFSSDHDLRMRVDAPGGGVFTEPMRVRVHQASGDALTLCGEGSAVRDGPLFVAARTRNPFFPLLVTLASPDGTLRAATLVPFPSLFAGGAHRGEVIARPSGGCRFEDARALSEMLLRDHLAGAGAPSLATIKVDATHATGAERVFSSPVLEWLALIAGIRVTIAEAPAFLADQHPDPAALPPAQRDAVGRRAREGLARLTLPCDALPSVTALFGRGALAAGGHVVGTFVVADPVDATPVACVSQPATASAGLDALQPAGAPLPFPWLTMTGSHDHLAAGAGTPVAIRYYAERPSDATLLLRRAPDAPGPLLAAAAPPVDGIEAIVAVPAVAERVPALLRSLANQAFAETLRVVIVVGRAAARDAEPIEASARALFGDRCRIVLAAGEDIAADLDAVAGASDAAHLLFVEDVLLHDPRTLEALVTLVQAPGVASAGCLLVAESGDRQRSIVAGSGGLFPAGEAGLTDRSVFAALPRATYASAGNGFRLALVSGAAWRAHGGGGSDEDRAAGFAVRALVAGLRHLTTSAVSASLREATPPVVATASADAVPAWRSALAAAPTTRAIRT